MTLYNKEQRDKGIKKRTKESNLNDRHKQWKNKKHIASQEEDSDSSTTLTEHTHTRGEERKKNRTETK